jgi:hypothetical protein
MFGVVETEIVTRSLRTAPPAVHAFVACSIGQAILNIVVWRARVGIADLAIACLAAVAILSRSRTAWAILLVVYGLGVVACIQANSSWWIVMLTTLTFTFLLTPQMRRFVSADSRGVECRSS